MATKRYVLHPGYVRTVDNQKTFMGSRALARAYGVPFEECVTPPDGERFHSRYYTDGQIHLHPRVSGVYPTVQEMAEQEAAG